MSKKDLQKKAGSFRRRVIVQEEKTERRLVVNTDPGQPRWVRFEPVDEFIIGQQKSLRAESK